MINISHKLTRHISWETNGMVLFQRVPLEDCQASDQKHEVDKNKQLKRWTILLRIVITALSLHQLWAISSLLCISWPHRPRITCSLDVAPPDPWLVALKARAVGHSLSNSIYKPETHSRIWSLSFFLCQASYHHELKSPKNMKEDHTTGISASWSPISQWPIKPTTLLEAGGPSWTSFLKYLTS